MYNILYVVYVVHIYSYRYIHVCMYGTGLFFIINLCILGARILDFWLSK